MEIDLSDYATMEDLKDIVHLMEELADKLGYERTYNYYFGPLWKNKVGHDK